MENLDVVENNGQDNFNNGADKPKGNKSKKILIVCSSVIALIAVIVVAAYLIIAIKYVKTVEYRINTALSDVNTWGNSNFLYEPFVCSGIKQITCKSGYMEMDDVFAKFTFKDFSFSLNPSVNNLGVSTKGVIDINTRDFGGNSLGNIDVNFNCGGDSALLSERSMLSGIISCNSNIGNIKLEKKNTFYIKNDILKEYKSMITLLHSLSDKDLDIANKIILSPSVITNIKSKISSTDLLDDAIEMVKQAAGKYADDITKESVITLYNSMKDDFLKYGSFFGTEEQVNVVKMLIDALGGVITNGNNFIDINLDLKDMSNLDNSFDNIDILNPKDYNISIQSGK